MKEQLITLFEQQSIPYQALGLETNDPLLEALDAINQKTGNEIIRIERKGLRTSQFVGVIKAGDYLIQILPKIDYGQDAGAEVVPGTAPYEKAAQYAARNFLHLLRYTEKLTLHNQSIASLSTSRSTWLEMLTRIFAIELLTQLQQGFNQDYVWREEYLQYVRGRWNIARQYSHQPDLTRGLDVSYDDYLPDTQLNRVFCLAVYRLQQITRDAPNRQMLADLESWLRDVQKPTYVSLDILNQVKFNRLNERFHPAFQLARLLLEGLSVQLMAGGQNANAFIFDMDQLFEQFIANIMQTYLHLILPEGWQGMSIEVQSDRTRRYLIQPYPPPDQPMFLMKPDIMIGFHGTPKLIIDTKNKALPIIQSHRGLQESDAFQMLAYATQFSCPNVLLLYPRTCGATKVIPKMLLVDRSPVRIFTASIDLHQPLDRITPIINELSFIIKSVYQQTGIHEEVPWHDY